MLLRCLVRSVDAASVFAVAAMSTAVGRERSGVGAAMPGRTLRRALLSGVLAPVMLAALAQDPLVQASVDRATVRENESFTYSIVAEGSVRDDPDTSAIEQQFDVLSRSSRTRIEIVNGQRRQVVEWDLELFPTGAGSFVLPPSYVAGAASNAVEVEILPAPESDGELPDVFIEVDAEPSTPYVQAQVLYTLRLFVGVNTGRATLTAPRVSGGEAIVERLGEDRQYQTTRAGRSFSVRERRYAIFPQQTGALTVGPATFEAMVVPTRGFSRVQRLRSDSLELDVRPAVAPPPEFPDAVWLPARALTLSQDWVDEQGRFSLGVPRTRMLTVEADGVLETQLPELVLATAPGIRQYPDQPDLDRRTSERGLQGRRVERYAVIAQNTGEIEIPGQELAWWNVDEARWDVARIEPSVVTVLPGIEPVFDDPAPDVPATVEGAPPAPPATNYWRLVSGMLATAWLATLVLWLRSRSADPAAGVQPARSPRRAKNRQLLRKLRAACEENDAAAAHGLLLQWAELRFPESPPQSLGVLADRLPPAVAAEIAVLEASVYGAGAEQWDGKGLAAALKRVDAVARANPKDKADPLLPLYR